MTENKQKYFPVWNKVVGIFSKALDRTIELNIIRDDRESCAMAKKIVVSPFSKKQLKEQNIKLTHEQGGYTLLEHELGHFTFDSDVKLMQAFVEFHRELPMAISRLIFGTLDDIRIESLWGELYRGSNMRFNELKKITIADDKIDTSPIAALMAYRAGKEHLLPDDVDKKLKEVCAYAAKAVHKSSCAHVVEVGNKVANAFKQWLKENPKTKDHTTSSRVSSDALVGNLLGQRIPESDIRTVPSTQEQKAIHQGIIETMQNIQKLERNNRQNKIDIKNYKDRLEELDEVTDEMQIKQINEAIKRLNKNIKNYDEMIEEQTKDLETQIKREQFKIDEKVKELRKKIQQPSDEENQKISRIMNEGGSGGWRYEDPTWNKNFRNIKGNPTIVRNIRKFLDRIRRKSTMVTDETGSLIDVDRLIQAKISPRPDSIFLQEDLAQGITIYLLIDFSGSMRGSPMQQAQQIAINMLDATQKYKGIKIKVFGYTGSTNTTYISEIKRKDLGRITGCVTGANTPSIESLVWLTKQLKKESGEKMLIHLTDGAPGRPKGLRMIDLKMIVRNALNRLRNNKIKVITILVYSTATRQYTQEDLKLMFGTKDFVAVKDYETAEEKIWNEIMRKVVILARR